jgi:asparagine synthase (glutamine-hydrolysing)
MCGIAGYVGPDRAAGRAFAARANHLLAHRGPDDEGTYVGDGVVLAHRRLSIVDLSAAGHEPMISPDGRWILVYNGEVYNHEALRPRLDRSWAFRSRCDAETVLAALALDGPAALEAMVGMWALLLWDAAERRLLVSRDRYGQKPLYWRRGPDGSVRFASEIRPLLEVGERPAAFVPAVAEYLATGNYGHLGDRTFFRDVRAVPAASWAHVRAGQTDVEHRRYWRFPVLPARERRPYDDEARRGFRDAFEDAVSSQLMSDVPLGATLSGGLDSSAVVGAIAALDPKRSLPVFTAQAQGTPFDESAYVKAVERRWLGRIEVHTVTLEPVRASGTLGEAIRVQEEPFGDPSIIAHGLLMDAARKIGIPVLLGGQGGDELLCGYPFMTDALLAASLRAGRVGWVMREARALGLPATSLGRIALSAMAPAVEGWARRRSRLRRRTWLSPVVARAAEVGAPLAATADASAVWLEAVERMALPHLTHYDDRSAMARSIEGRMPFLDHRLADVIGRLEYRALVDGGSRKRILRDTCGDLLPEAVLARRDKIGFFTPLREMLAAEQEWVRGMVTDEYARSLAVFDAPTVGAHAQALSNRATPTRVAQVVWRALSVRVWAETFGVAALEAD